MHSGLKHGKTPRVPLCNRRVGRSGLEDRHSWLTLAGGLFSPAR